MKTDRARLLFLGVCTALAVTLALLVAELPPSWRDAAILWLIVGCPFTFALPRLWRGYVQLQLEAMARAPQQRPAVATKGAGERDRGELRVVEVAKGEHGRRML